VLNTFQWRNTIRQRKYILLTFPCVDSSTPLSWSPSVKQRILS